MFHLWGYGIGQGLIGGKVVDHEYYGELSAKIISDLIDGEKIQDYKVSTVNRNRYLFDYKVLKKFNIDPDLLPLDSVVINKSRLFSKQAVVIFIFLLSVIAILTAVVIIILNLYKYKSNIEKNKIFIYGT